MSRLLRVAIAAPYPVQQHLTGRAAVEFMKEFWQNEFDNVLPDAPDLIVVPEVADRLPAMTLPERFDYYHIRGNQIRDLFRETARKNHCWVTYPAVRELPDGTLMNSTQLIDRQGEVRGVYDKNYPTRGEVEDQNIAYGRDMTIVDTEFGKVGMIICFDLNFHELLEKYAARRPQLMLFSSMFHGGLMQNYWAYHCQSYFVGAIAMTDESTIIDPLGEKIARTSNYSPFITREINLDYQVIHLDFNAKKLKQAKNKYGSGIEISDPGHLGSVLLTSKLEHITAEDIVREFDIGTWDDYYRQTMIRRHDFEKNNMRQ